MFVPANAVFKKEKENITNIRQLVYIRDIKKVYITNYRHDTRRSADREKNETLNCVYVQVH